jgi:tetratricopeptide (TPR) repeat protein
MKNGESYLNQALYFNPFRGDTLYLLGTTQLSLKKDNEGERNLKMALNFVNDKGIMNNLGFIYQRRGKLKIALDYFMRSYLYEPRNCETPNNLAMLNMKLKKSDECEKYLKIAIKNNEYYLTALNNLGDFYLRKKQIDEAERYYKQVVSKNPEIVVKKNLSKRVFAYVNKGTLFGEYSHAYYGLGQIYSMKNRKKMAERFFLESLRYMKNNDMVIYRLALFYLKYDEKGKAISLLEKVYGMGGRYSRAAQAVLKKLGVIEE